MTTVRRWSGHEARMLRRALRMSIRAFPAHLGVAARTVSKWDERGASTFPLPETQAILDMALHRADDSAKSRFELLLDEHMDEDVDDMNRRAVLGIFGPLAASPLAGRLEDVRRGLDGMLGTEPVDRDADDWERTVADYAREVGATPALQVLPNIVADFADIQADFARSRSTIRKRLVHSASQLATLTAIALINAGERHSAQRWWRTAAHAAAVTGDHNLVALVRGRHAVMSLYNSPPERVLELADHAVAAGRSSPSVGVISGFAAQAQALGQLGRHDESAAAMGTVLDLFTRLPATASNCSTSQWNWGEQRLHHVVSHVHACAGRLNEAGKAQDSALAVYPGGNFQGGSQIEHHRAAALIQSGDVGAGADHLRSTMERLEPWQRDDGIVARSAMLTLDLVPRTHHDRPEVRLARESVSMSERKKVARRCQRRTDTWTPTPPRKSSTWSWRRSMRRAMPMSLTRRSTRPSGSSNGSKGMCVRQGSSWSRPSPTARPSAWRSVTRFPRTHVGGRA
ncbi:helix-turn-helix domain-containing protein [Actinophytocola sp.]|uniref:helix-turn-helix domain-containing protein n=1 Tax=Actinophytocola sp. TaxID=1872138 RepID=UPI002ED47000